MHSPVQALLWQLWRQQRWGFVAVYGYLLVAGVVIQLAPASVILTELIPMPMTFGLLYLMTGFTYGWEVDLASKNLAFPKRLFTLPVRTTQLVFWPMLTGALAVILAWIGLAVWVLRPSGKEAPLVWPGLMFTTVLA